MLLLERIDLSTARINEFILLMDLMNTFMKGKPGVVRHEQEMEEFYL